MYETPNQSKLMKIKCQTKDYISQNQHRVSSELEISFMSRANQRTLCQPSPLWFPCPSYQTQDSFKRPFWLPTSMSLIYCDTRHFLAFVHHFELYQAMQLRRRLSLLSNAWFSPRKSNQKLLVCRMQEFCNRIPLFG